MHLLIKVLTVKIILSLPSLGTCTYDPRCPHNSQAKFRSQVICNGQSHYACLFDTNDQKYKELCTEEKIIQSEGHKSVLRGPVDGIYCDHRRFQPFSYTTTIGPECAFIKSSCFEEGQIISSNGSSKEDVSCKCDYREGYSYIKMPKNKCSCNPKQEDCSCYLIPCNVDEILNQDYQCKCLAELTGKFRCKAIKETQSDRKTETAKKTNLKKDAPYLTELRLSYLSESAVTYILTFVLGIITGMAIVYFMKHTDDSTRKFNDYVTKLGTHNPKRKEGKIRRTRHVSCSSYFEPDEPPEYFRRRLHS